MFIIYYMGLYVSCQDNLASTEVECPAAIINHGGFPLSLVRFNLSKSSIDSKTGFISHESQATGSRWQFGYSEKLENKE